MTRTTLGGTSRVGSVLGAFLLCGAVGGEAVASENYMIHRTPLTYEFIDAETVKVVDTGVREALVIDVNVGTSAAALGYKVIARLVRFRCASSTFAVVAQRTFSPVGEVLTTGSATPYVTLAKGDKRDEARFRFVCQDDRTFSNYFGEDPASAADKLYALLNTPR